MRAVPVLVVQGVDLDHLGAEVGEGAPGERTRHSEPEVEHAHAFERVRRLAPTGGRLTVVVGGVVGRGRQGAHLVGVLARARRRTGDGPRRGRELQEHAGVADRTLVRVVHLGDATIGEERLVGQRVGG